MSGLESYEVRRAVGQRRAYRVFADASGVRPPDQIALGLVFAYAQLYAAGQRAGAATLLAALRRHGGEVFKTWARQQMDAAELAVFGRAETLLRRLARWERAQQARRQARMDAIFDAVHGEGSAARRREMDRLAVAVFGVAEAARRRAVRRERARQVSARLRLDAQYGRVFGSERLVLLRLRRRVAAVTGRVS